MPADRRRMRPSRLLLAVLLAALAVGVAASVLTEVRSAGPPPPVGPSQGVVLPAWVVAAVVIGFVLLLLVPIIYDRIVNGGSPLPGRFIVFALTFLLLMVAFVEVAHAFGFTGGLFGAEQSVNSTQNKSVPPTPNSTGVNLTGHGSHLATGWGPLPPWGVFLAVVIVAVAVAAVGAPRLFEYLRERRDERWTRRATDEAALALHGALGRAGLDLEQGKDPREVVLALYAELLRHLRPLVADVEHETPEEIRARHLVRLGVRPAAAEALTRVFEEARYSTHRIGEGEVSRATTAIRDAEVDLARALAGP